MVLLDSSFLIAYHNRRDVHHERAAGAMRDLLEGRWGKALLLEYVFLEVVTVLLARRGLARASSVASALLGAREVDFVPCSQLFLDAVQAFQAQASGGLSFTDAAIVAAARRHQVARVATFDADFRDLPGIEVVPDR